MGGKRHTLELEAELLVYWVNWHLISDVSTNVRMLPRDWLKQAQTKSPSLMAPPLRSHYPWPQISMDHISTPRQPLSFWDPSPNSMSSASHLGLVWRVVAFSSPNSETTKNISLQDHCIKIPYTHRDTPTRLQEKGAWSLSKPSICLQGTSNRSVSSIYWNKHQSNQLFGIMWAKYK